MRMKYFKFFILLLLICLTGCSKTIIDELPKGYYINIKQNDILVYDNILLKDIIENTNLDINKNVSIKTDKLGENIYNLHFKIKRKNYLYHIKYNVVDNVKPVVISSTRTVKKGYDNNLCSLISYGDNYDRNPSCNVKGTYDVNTPGVYDISFSIKDSSDNELIYNMKLNVIDNTTSTNNNSSNTDSSILFSDIYNNYKSDDNKIGIDVSRWQKNIDFKKVKESGCEFVFIRIGVQKEINGIVTIDPKFKENYKKAKEASLDVGVYLYSMASSKKEASKQASWVIKTLNNEKLELPIVFDWENFSSFNSYNLNFNDINSIALSYLDTLKKNGYDGMLYSSKNYLENIWNIDNYSVWLAHYTNNTNYSGKYKVWQLTNNAKIDGIDNLVDVDILYK